MDLIAQLERSFISQIDQAEDLQQLEVVRVSALGKQGQITELLKSLGQRELEDRKTLGPIYNKLRQNVMAALGARKQLFEDQLLEASLQQQSVDMSLPVQSTVGYVHPLSQALFEATSVLEEMGFVVTEGPEIETDYYNFSALNIPKLHPARQEQDTFYLPPDQNGEIKLLRTQTSPVQIRTMQQLSAPIKIISPGRVFRSDYDQTHTPVFHQIEGLYIDKHIHMGHLKGCLLEFCRRFFETDDIQLRFRPAYFPFTEPSAEIDIGCTFRQGRVTIGGQEDWLEVLGSGFVHPQVLINCGLDPEVWQGFAFGLGVERFAMLKYGIHDLRLFYENDCRWLKHYGFSAFNALIKDQRP